jgi:ribosomal protein S27E
VDNWIYYTNSSDKEYLYKIGDIIKDKRNLVIIDMEYREASKGSKRFYKYKCKVCGNEDWIREDAVTEQNQGCNVCSGHKVILGYNDIPTTVPWMVKYFQRGYDEAKLYTKTGSGNPNNRYGKINPICPDCDRIKSKKVRINDIYRNHTIGCSCSDSIPYPEKVLFSVFEQLGVDFQTQLNKTTFDWCGKYKYDFYFKLNNERILTETHGRQHYEDAWDKLEKTQTNDRIKKELALVNGIKEENYIIIDCRYSELDWIKQHILESNLAKMFDLSKIDWLKAEEFASSNRVNEACDLWNSGIHSTTQIGIIMKLHGTTVMRYLKIGYDLDLCNYTKSISAKEAVKNATLSTSKQVICCENGIIFKHSRMF